VASASRNLRPLIDAGCSIRPGDDRREKRVCLPDAGAANLTRLADIE
jgi:hypothetical protein